MVKLKIDFDTKDFENNLRLFSSNLGVMFREEMALIGKDMVSEARSRAAFTNRTGKLFKAVKFIPTGTGIVFTTRNNLQSRKNNVFYARMVEHGANIEPRKKKYLVFKINGEWKKVESVQLRPRPFMEPVFDEYWGNENARGFKLLKAAMLKKAGEELA